MASIPLPALSVRPPADPSEMAEKFIALKGMIAQQQQQAALMPGAQQIQQQQIQAGALENQSRQQDMDARNALNKAYATSVTTDAQGKASFDPDKLQSTLATGPAAYKTPEVMEGISKFQKSRVDLQNSTQDLKAKQTDMIGGAASAVKAAGYDPVLAHSLLDSMPPSPQLDQIRGMIDSNPQGFKQLIDSAVAQSPKQAEAFKNTQQGNAAAANTGKIKAEMDFYQKQGLAPGVPLDAQEASDWMNKNPGKGLAEFMKMKAGLSAQANATAQAGLLSDAAKKMAADNYTQTGALPTGLRSPAMAAGVLNQAAAGPNGIPNIAANKMNYKADSGSLAALQKNFDQVTAFENTAGKNLDVFLSQAQKVVDSGNPMINRPLRTIVGSMGGTDQAAFDTARTTALTEIAKVLNSSNASGVLSDSARHEVEGLIRPNATLAQIVSAAKILKTDMGNRHDSYQQQIDAIKARGNPQAAPTPAPGGKEIHYKVVDGQLVAQ